MRGSRDFATALAVTTFAGIIASAGAQMEERWLRDQSPPQCIFGDWLFCLADANADATTATQLANGLFMYMVYVLICLVSSRYIHGIGSKWRANFGGSMLLGLVLIQYYSVFMAAMGNYPYDGKAAYRWDCLESTKGGKISKAMYDEGSERAFNPCYCHSNATCKYKSHMRLWNQSDECPRDADFVCFENYNLETQRAYKSGDGDDTQADRRKVYPLLGSPKDEGFRRDCKFGQKDKCTRQNPCTPCELDKLVAFDATRCETCSVFNRGDCNFVPGVGPYCWESPDYNKHGETGSGQSGDLCQEQGGIGEAVGPSLTAVPHFVSEMKLIAPL